MIRHLKSALTLTLLLCVAPSAFALTRSGLLPADTQFDLRISNTVSFWDQLKKSPLGKLWMDQQFQDFIGNPDEETWNEFLFEGEKSAEDEMTMEQVKMLKGEVLVALGKDPEELYIIAAMSAEDFERSLSLDERMSKVAEEPFDIVKSDFQGIEVIQHITHPGAEEDGSIWQAHLKNTLILGPNRTWLEKSITRLKEEAVEEPEGNPVLDFNLPLSTLIKEAVAEAESEEQSTPGVNTTALFESLGLMGIEKFSIHAELKDNEMTVDNNLVATGLDHGIFTILNMAPAELPTVGFIPANISLLEVGRLDLLRFWQEIPTILMAAMPEAKPQFDMALGMIRQQTGVDLEHDLLTYLGNQYLSFSIMENEALNTVIALELRDGQAFKQGLETILNAPTVQPQIAMALDTVDFLDHTLYVSKNTPPEDSFAFAVSGHYLLYGQPDGVRQVLRSESSETAVNPQLEQTELVQGLRRYTPQNAFGYSAVDWKKNMIFLIRELTRPQYTRMILGQWATSGSPIPPPDMNKLPSTDHLASFFNMSYQYIEKTDRGLHQKITIKY